MKKFKILAMILIGVIAICSSGMVDASYLSFLPDVIKPMDGLKLGMAIAVGDVISEYGAYYENAGQNKSKILKQLLIPYKTTLQLTPYKTDNTLFKLSKASIDSIVQPFQKAFTAKGTLTFKPVPIQLYNVKVDHEEYPDDLKASWLGFLESSDLPRTQWPLIRYAIEEFLLPKIKEDMELYEIYKGVYASPTPGAAGAVGTSMNGFQKLLQDGVDDGTINSVPLETITSSNAFDEIETFIDGIGAAYQDVPMAILCDPAVYKFYMRDKRTQGFYQKFSDKDIDSGVDFSPQFLQPVRSMSGTGELFCTPKSNLVYVTKNDINANRFEVQGVDRQVKFLTDWWEGVGFGINEIVWTNIVAES